MTSARSALRSLALATAVGTVAVAALASPAVGSPSADDAPPKASALVQKVSVPAYFYPGATWDQLVGAGNRVGLAIANPFNGPGTGDPQYTRAIQRARTAGMTVIGYVATGYFGTTGITTRNGSTDPAEWMRQIKGDVDTWYRLYGSAGVGGIFFDEALSRCGAGNADVNRYIELRAYVEQRHGAASTVVDNPGTGVEECYTAAADTLVTFEGNDASYRTHRPQGWEARVPAERIWHMVYASPDESTLRTAMSLSKQRNAGHVYVTPDTIADGNPWDTLPPASYWAVQLSLASGS
ncbi:spherulation-specific family 4 protein [Streptomyces microflavus]|uniref:spherulation-specific family 4 protein n=1 Tax=Streptomyces microflavus TaxID=1919 RepID=UPI0029AF6CBA|nr:spherulation-specific family 4 protein [Streptomyces microflavus]MDX2406744.1 spherulation-specific family 4 protein [Streptomyces microflavus]